MYQVYKAHFTVTPLSDPTLAATTKTEKLFATTDPAAEADGLVQLISTNIGEALAERSRVGSVILGVSLDDLNDSDEVIVMDPARISEDLSPVVTTDVEHIRAVNAALEALERNGIDPEALDDLMHDIGETEGARLAGTSESESDQEDFIAAGSEWASRANNEGLGAQVPAIIIGSQVRDALAAIESRTGLSFSEGVKPS